MKRKKKKQQKSKKKKIKMNTERYGLKKQNKFVNRKDLIDQDYLKKLSEDELEWLNDFNLEYVHASFNKSTRVHPKLMVDKTNKTTTKIVDKYKNDSETMNNARNNDSFTVTKGRGKLEYFSGGRNNIEKSAEDYVNHPNIVKDGYEIALNAAIDFKNKIRIKVK